MNIGKSIIKLRVNKLNQSQRFFADQIGITQSYLSQIENGKKQPSTDLLQKIAELLKTPLPILFWFAIDETDVNTNKIEHFNFIKPTIDKMIESIFLFDTPAVVGRSESFVCGHPPKETYLLDGIWHCEKCGGKWKSIANK